MIYEKYRYFEVIYLISLFHHYLVELSEFIFKKFSIQKFNHCIDQSFKYRTLLASTINIYHFSVSGGTIYPYVPNHPKYRLY